MTSRQTVTALGGSLSVPKMAGRRPAPQSAVTYLQACGAGLRPAASGLLQTITRLCLIAVLAGSFTAASAQTPAYKNPDLPAEQRAADIVSRMTLDEKV